MNIGRPALIGVPVATIWTDPSAPRQIDRLALGSGADVQAWAAALGPEDRRGLVGRVATQALLGERVMVEEERTGWARVNLPRQPSSLDHRGYPGWLPLEQLVEDRPEPSGTQQLVSRATTGVVTSRGRGETLLSLSFATPLYSAQNGACHADGGAATAAMLTRTGERVSASGDALMPAESLRMAGRALVSTAKRLLGIEYLWGGTSGFGLDCSGLIWLVLTAHGIEAPRDAHDQALAGARIDREDLMAGDLVFFANRGEGGRVHHVGMALNHSCMLHAPRPGRCVELASLDERPYVDELTEGRRLW